MKRKIRNNWNIVIQLILSVLFGAVMLTGCTDDAFQPAGGGAVDQTGVPEGFLRARVNLVASGFDVVRTKSLTNQQEHEWSHVVVGQFDHENKLVTTSVQKHSYGSNGNFDMILKKSNGDENLIYFITNYGDVSGALTDSKNNPFMKPGTSEYVADLDEFKSMVYTPDSTDNASISAGDKLVMIGSIKTVVADEPTPVSSILVYVDKLTAKLDVQIKASQSISDPINHPFNASTLSITGLKIVNVPKHAAFSAEGDQIINQENLASIDATLVDAGGDLVKTYNTSESYYILENRMHDDAVPLQPTEDYQKGIEQYKNQAAIDHGIADLATYLLIEGNLNDGRHVGKATWKIYLGENNVDNFNIKRNTHYTITVQIDGAGIVTSDIRVNKNNLYVRELRYLNGRYASNRSPETSYPGPNDNNWGNLVSPAPIADPTYLYMDAGDKTWGFRLTGMNGAALPDWPGLSLSYLPLADPNATDPGNIVGMNVQQARAKWLADNVENNWKTPPGLTSGTGLPSGARVRINIGPNSTPSERTVELHYFNDLEPDPKTTRVWRLVQSAGEMLNVVQRNFFPSEAGRYGVMVRAHENTYWKLQAGSDSNFTFAGAANSKGEITQTDLNTGYVKGHGTILFDTRQYTGVPYLSMTLSVRTYVEDPNVNPESDYVDKPVYIYQMASADNFVATKDRPTGRYVYDYSTDPLFETMFAYPTAIPMGINLLEEGKAYNLDESLYGAYSTTDGKENTLKIFQKLEKYVAENTIHSGMGLTAPPVFSPAGICMMMNKNWQTITSKDDPDFEWYLPARYHGLMGATYVMLGIEGIGNASQASFWTSTVPLTKPKEERHSAYFAGTSVDVSANYSATSAVRCVRDNKNVVKSYPYLTEDYAGNPVVVTYEKVGGEEKGFVKIKTGSGNYSVYKLGKPLRFTEEGQASNFDGVGPSDPNWSYLSPKFRVAKQDAVISGSSLSGQWTAASGWKDADATDIATPATGCAAYNEDGTGWRVPSELEMRMILLLGGGIGSAPGSVAQVPAVQTGGKSFTDFVPSGFNYLGTTNGISYWANRKYQGGNRIAYLSVSGKWETAINGSALDWDKAAFVRCVRDM